MKNRVEPILNMDLVKYLIWRLGLDSKRNQLIFFLGVYTGMRATDMLALNVKDIKNPIIRVKLKKTNKYIDYELPKELFIAFADFVKDKNDDEPLFVSQKGTRLSRGQVYKIINKYCKMCGIKAGVGTELMRKIYAYKHLLEHQNIRLLRMLLRQSSLKATCEYLGLDPKEVLGDRRTKKYRRR